MHTKELARALRVFAGIAEFDRSRELHLLADFLERGRSETMASRIKRSTPSTRYPSRLKETLETIALGMRSIGAIKPSIAIGEVLKLFAGHPDGSSKVFLEEISIPRRMPDASKRRFKSANIDLAKKMCTELVAASEDASRFHRALAELDSSLAGTATWTLVANHFIGNRRSYRDRKSATRAIQDYFDSLPARSAYGAATNMVAEDTQSSNSNF